MNLVSYRRQFADRVQNDEEKDVKDTLQGIATMLYASLEAYRVKKERIAFQTVNAKRPRCRFGITRLW